MSLDPTFLSTDYIGLRDVVANTISILKAEKFDTERRKYVVTRIRDLFHAAANPRIITERASPVGQKNFGFYRHYEFFKILSGYKDANEFLRALNTALEVLQGAEKNETPDKEKCNSTLTLLEKILAGVKLNAYNPLPVSDQVETSS